MKQYTQCHVPAVVVGSVLPILKTDWINAFIKMFCVINYWFLTPLLVQKFQIRFYALIKCFSKCVNEKGSFATMPHTTGHYDVIAWARFHIPGPFVRGSHSLQMVSHHEWPVTPTVDGIFVVSLNKLWSKESSRWTLDAIISTALRRKWLQLSPCPHTS